MKNPATGLLTEAEETAAATPWALPQVEGPLVSDESLAALTDRPPTAAQLDSIHADARNEGYTAGKNEGFNQGYQEGSELARVEWQQKAERLDELLHALAEPFRQLDQKVEESLVSLSINIARQLVRRELKTNPGEIVGVVREALAVLPAATNNVSLILHPEDASLVRDVFSTQEGETAWTIVEDPVLARGGCRIETATSKIDASVEARLAAIFNHLLGGERQEDDRT